MFELDAFENKVQASLSDAREDPRFTVLQCRIASRNARGGQDRSGDRFKSLIIFAEFKESFRARAS